MTFSIYLISLEQDKLRRELLQERFPEYYDAFILIHAIDGRKLDAGIYYEKTFKYFEKNNRIISPTELGCTLSHIKTLREFLKTDADFALILEDDIIGTDEDLKKMSTFTDLLNENSLLLCGGQEGLTTRRYQFGKLEADKFYSILKFSYKYVLRTCCYVVSRKSAEAILESHENFLVLADEWNTLLGKSNISIFYSKIFAHPEDLSTSHIEAERVRYRKSIIEKILDPGVFKRLLNKLEREFFSIFYKLRGFARLP